MAKFGLMELIEQIKKRPPEGLSIEGTHYSNNPDPMRRADGSAYGNASAGAEKGRLTDANKNRTFFYPNDARQQQGYATPRPEPVVRGAPYQSKLHDMYDLKMDPLGIARQSKSRNEFEAAIKQMGYRGYVNPDQGMMVNLQDETEMLKLGDYRSQAEGNLERAARLPDSPYHVTAENKPSTDTPFGAWLGGKPELQERYQDQIEGLLDKRNFMKELGVKDYNITPGYGGYEGNVSPNSVIRVPDEQTAQLVADARGVATQQDAVPYYQKKGGDTAGMSATMDRTITPGILDAIHNETGLDMTRSSGDTMDFLNFKGEDGVPFSGRSDEDFRGELSSVFEKLGSSIEGVSPFQAQSNYNFTGGALPSGPAHARLQSAGPASGEMRARIIAENEAFRKQWGFSDPKLLALLGGGTAAGLASQNSEASHAGLLQDAVRLAKSKEWGATDQDYFHGTRADIGEFDPNKGDLGTHIGTARQANNRLEDTAFDNPAPDSPGMYGNDASIMPLKTRANNPALMSDVGTWNNADAVRQSLEGNVELRDLPGMQGALDDAYVGRQDFDQSPKGAEDWVASDANRDSLNAIREVLQEAGYDSIKYDNAVESRGRGLLDGPAGEVKVLQEQIRDLQGKLYAEKPIPDVSGMTPEEMKVAVEKWYDTPRIKDPVVESEIAHLNERRSNIFNDPTNSETGSSLIVLDPDDLRSSSAAFEPDGMQDMSKPGLLRSAAPVGAGGLLAAGAMTPEQAQAQGMRDAGQQVASSVEGMGREVWGALKGLWSGDEKQRTDVTSQRSIEAPQGLDDLKGLLGQAVGEPLLEGLQSAQDAAYPAVTNLLEYQPLVGPEVGQQISNAGEGISSLWGMLSPENQERATSAAILGTMLPGSKGAKAGAEGLTDLIDPRYFNLTSERKLAAAGGYEPKKLEMQKRDMGSLPEINLADLEGRDAIFSISDRAPAGGQVVGVDGRRLPIPVDAQGGQDAMIDPGGRGAYKGTGNPLWMSDKGPAQGILNMARQSKAETGVDPVFMPWRMTPRGIDHSTHSGDLMLSNALGTLGKGDLKEMDKMIRGLSRTTDKGSTVAEGIPNWPGLADKPEESMAAWANATGNQRKAIKTKVLHAFRKKTGMSQSDARVAMTDPNQLHSPDFGFQNVGILDAASDLGPRSSRTYSATLHGQPYGTMKQDGLTIFDILPELLHDKGGDINRARRSAETRAVRKTITPSLLEMLGY